MPESLTPELRKLQTRVKSFIEEELQPLDEGLDGDPYAPIPDQVRKRVREASESHGLYGASLPSDVGGLAAGPLALVVIR
ncbi:MAG: acyl-CoA dehydrogenase family protein, partial [Chloroflexi bacterium]|nr:acyl-CoA dehydrogenase family protein [Chloroflexota bacterium]